MTSNKVPSSKVRQRTRNLLIVIGGFFGPFALIYFVEPNTWLVILLAVVIGVVGGELLNTSLFRIMEARKHVYLRYYVRLAYNGLETKPVETGIAALRAKSID